MSIFNRLAVSGVPVRSEFGEVVVIDINVVTRKQEFDATVQSTRRDGGTLMRAERITTVYVAPATNRTSTEPTVTTTRQSFGRLFAAKNAALHAAVVPYTDRRVHCTRVYTVYKYSETMHAAQYERNSCGGGRVSCIVTAEPSSRRPGQQHLPAAGDHAGTTHVTPVLYTVHRDRILPIKNHWGLRP